MERMRTKCRIVKLVAYCSCVFQSYKNDVNFNLIISEEISVHLMSNL